MALGRLDHVGAAAQNRRARVAVAALFLTNGALFANLLPRYPEIKADLQLSNAVYGVAIAAFSGGALVAGLAAATLIRRYQSARVAVVGSIGIAVFVFVAALAPSAVALASALFIAGASDAVTDVGQNAHALRVQRNYGRSIINSFHAVWSAGAVLGGAMGAAAIALHVPRTTHLAVVGGSVQCGRTGRLPVPAPRARSGRPPVDADRGRRATRFRRLRNAGRAGVHRDLRGDRRRCRKFLGDAVFARQSRRTGRDRRIRIHRDGRLPIRRAADRRPTRRPVRRARGGQGRRTHHSRGHGRGAGISQCSRHHRRVSPPPVSVWPRWCLRPCTAPTSCRDFGQAPG